MLHLKTLPGAILLVAVAVGCGEQATEPEISTSPLFSHVFANGDDDPTFFDAIIESSPLRTEPLPPLITLRFLRPTPGKARGLQPISCGTKQEPWLIVAETGKRGRGKQLDVAAVEIGASEHISNGATALNLGEVGSCGTFRVYVFLLLTG